MYKTNKQKFKVRQPQRAARAARYIVVIVPVKGVASEHTTQASHVAAVQFTWLMGLNSVLVAITVSCC